MPRTVHIWTWLLAMVSVLLTPLGALVAPAVYRGVPALDSADEICRNPPKFWDPVPLAGCGDQVQNRSAAFHHKQAALARACKRRDFFTHELNDQVLPLTRQALREEESETVRLYGSLRDFVGPRLWPDVAVQLLLMSATVLVGLAALHLAGYHARNVGIPRLSHSARIRRPLLLSSAVTLAVAIGVTCGESLDPGKTGFDWASYCLSGALSLGGWSTHAIAGPSFWIVHSSIVSFAFFIGIQVATGWYVTDTAFVPVPDANEPTWGVSGYVRFLETWCYLTVVSVGLVTAVWIRELALSPSRTSITNAFLGMGAFVPFGWLVCRFVLNARELRRRCKHARATSPYTRGLPEDPRGGLFTEEWWQVPALFVAAFGIVSALLNWSGLWRLFGVER